MFILYLYKFICSCICVTVMIFSFFKMYPSAEQKKTHQRICLILPAPPLTSCEGRAYKSDLFMLCPFNIGIKDKAQEKCP